MTKLGVTKSLKLDDGREISIETGKLAKQADGSVVLRMGDTMLLATVVSGKEAKEGIDFLPLTVEYKEKFSAAGKFPGGFFKREARPAESEILTARLVDRALRPLFPGDYHAGTQVIISLISADEENLPDALACTAASAAIAVSDIPFAGPVAEARVARVNGQFVINPTFDQLEQADMEMMVAATKENIMMVEGEMNEVSEEEMIQAIDFAHQAIKKQCELQEELAAMVEKAKEKREYDHETNDEALEKKVHDDLYDECYSVAKRSDLPKKEKKQALREVLDTYLEKLSEEELSEKGELIKKYFGGVQKKAIRNAVLDDGVRLDNRKMDEIRDIWCEVDYLPGTHGSAIFSRGETQAMVSLTLGTKLDSQTVDTVTYSGSESFMLHYNFPPFCTGEERPLRGTSRREIGHGNLALRALKKVIPSDNPYTIRLLSDVLESNGSSSMATVCGGNLALMDAGVKITRPVSGIAMGLIAREDGKYAVLSDILGDEDHLGDMDFKITGTEKGITACQMDIKVDGLSQDIMKEALDQAKRGRHHILGEMMKTIDKPREDYKANAPRIVEFEVPQDAIGGIIGPGGKIIQEIQKDTGAVISIDEVNGKGVVEVSSRNKESLDAATAKIKRIAFPPTVEVGEIYEGKVKTIMPYGAFVEIIPGTDGLLHISELDWNRVEKVEDVIQEGEVVKFKITGKDPKNGKLKLSRKALLPKEN